MGGGRGKRSGKRFLCLTRRDFRGLGMGICSGQWRKEGFPDVEGEGVDIWVMYRLKEDQFVKKK